MDDTVTLVLTVEQGWFLLTRIRPVEKSLEQGKDFRDEKGNVWGPSYLDMIHDITDQLLGVTL